MVYFRMVQKFLGNKNLALVGFLQAVGVTLYCALVAVFFFYLTKTKVQPPGFFGFFLILALLVFSAAITGSLVFGYGAYLTLVKNQIREAFTILLYTLLFTLLIILTTVILI